MSTNDDIRQTVSALVDAEKRIGAAARKANVRWKWAEWSKPSTGGPFMWNDILITSRATGWSRLVQAEEFVNEVMGA